MSHFPPFPPNQSGRYSPNRNYGDRPPFPPPMPPPRRDFPPYPYPQSAPPPPPSTYRPYDNYPPQPPRPPYPSYDQPRGPYEDHYDPYQPAVNSYNPVPIPPPIRIPPIGYPSASTIDQPPRRHSRQPSPPTRRSGPTFPRQDLKPAISGPPELTLTTHPTTVNIGGFTAAVHALPPSRLPITKYVSLNRDDAIDLHRQLCSSRSSVWYADGSSRAGEAWCAAVEWKLTTNLGGSKMRGHILGGDALEAELGGIFKAAEGFKELLQQSIKDGLPFSPELTVFCDSQAAIVGIDTSSRPEALKFDQLWRDICSEYLQAHMTLVWIPKDSGVEGHVLADKIATVGASNSYLKRRKDRNLADIYMRPGGGEPEPSAGSVPGPWQRGDSDPSRPKIPYDRPKPTVLSPPVIASSVANEVNNLKLDLGAPQPSSETLDGEDEGIQPQEGAIFVTHFPHEASAKDIGILFAQYGEILAVDIFHISPTLPRYANVTYSNPASGIAAINDLHRKPINLDTTFAHENEADLELWKNWGGQMTVVLHEPPRIVPAAVEADFPDLPDWAKGDAHKNEEEETMEVEGQMKEERSPSPDPEGKKRERDTQVEVTSLPTDSLPEPSPKRVRLESVSGTQSVVNDASDSFNSVDSAATVVADPAHIGPASLTEEVKSHLTETSQQRELPHVNENVNIKGTVSTDPPPAIGLPPFPSTLKPIEGIKTLSPPQDPLYNVLHTNGQQATHTPSALPPTPLTAEQPTNPEVSTSGSPYQSIPQSTSSSLVKPTITNSASEPQEHPIKISAKTLRAHLSLVQNSLTKHEVNNWIAHTCLIAHDIDHARRALQADLYATDECFLSGRELEKTLISRGFTASRVDAFITKVLKVLDGIAAAEEPESEQPVSEEDIERLQSELTESLSNFPNETKEAMSSAARVMEFLVRGKDLQEKKRLEVERRVKVLEGMVKVGEVVGGVVRYLLTEDK